MKWENLRPSSNVEDKRGGRGGPIAMGGGIGALLIALLVYFMGGDPSVVTQGMSMGEQQRSTQTSGQPAADDPLAAFSSRVLGSTEDVWTALFQERGSAYEAPRLVLFSDSVRSACGTAGAAVGPFYCPGDKRVYIDLSFYGLLKERLGAPGDFAQAYVVAHEIGHHVQNLLGTLSRADSLKSNARSEVEANQVQVRVELQADCYAGIWAQRVGKQGNILEQGDIEEAMTAASRIGDDVLQQQSQGRVVPDSFTHGSAAQRREWLARGVREGDVAACDTFAGTTEYADRGARR